MDRLDDFIKGKLEQEHIEFNEAHWVQATGMIENQEQEKRRRFWFWLFTGQLLATILILTFVLWVTTNKAPSIPSPEKQVIQANKNSQKTNVNPSIQKEETKHIDPQNLKIEQSKTEKSNTKNDKQQILVETTKIFIETSTQQRKNTQNEAFETIKTSDNQKALSETKPNTHPNILSNQNLEKIQSPTNSKTLEETPTIENSLLTKRYAAAGFIPVKLKLLENKRLLNLEKKIEIQNNTKAFHSILSIYAASSLYPYPQGAAKRLIGYTAGLNYCLNLRKAWSLETGIHYRVRQGSFLQSQSSEQTQYAFGKSRVKHFLLPEQIHFIEVPLAVSYTKHRHKAFLGMNYSRLLGVRGSLNKEGIGENFPTPSTEKIESGWIKDSNFKKNHLDLLAGYYFAINPNIRLGAAIHYSLGGILNTNNSSNFYIESKPLFIDFGIRFTPRF